MDNQAILSAAHNGEKKGKKHIISSAFEHHAVLYTLKTCASCHRRPHEVAHGSLRLSLGADNTEEAVEQILQAVPAKLATEMIKGKLLSEVLQLTMFPYL